MSVPPPPFDADATRWSARRIGSSLIDAARTVAGRFPAPSPVTRGALACGFLGRDGDGHALRHPPLYVGFTPHEPQITKALAHFLDGDGKGAVRVHRARSLVVALFAAIGRAVPEQLDLDSADRRLTIEAEPRFQRRKRASHREDRRIDVLIRWIGRDENERAVVVEAKFDHRATTDQLPGIRTHAVERFGGIENVALFLVGVKDDRLISRNPDWNPVRWEALSRRWEGALAGIDGDADFARFRASLWLRGQT